MICEDYCEYHVISVHNFLVDIYLLGILIFSLTPLFFSCSTSGHEICVKFTHKEWWRSEEVLKKERCFKYLQSNLSVLFLGGANHFEVKSTSIENEENKLGKVENFPQVIS